MDPHFQLSGKVPVLIVAGVKYVEISFTITVWFQAGGGSVTRGAVGGAGFTIAHRSRVFSWVFLANLAPYCCVSSYCLKGDIPVVFSG